MNLLYAQSGGVTPVINTTAAGVIEQARLHPDRIGTVYAALNGIVGVLENKLVDTAQATDYQVRSLCSRPGGVFGSCRYKLPQAEDDDTVYHRIMEVCQHYDIGAFLYNGGNDSHDTAAKIEAFARQQGVSLQCIGVPKTIDNDLPVTDFSPGFGSVAKYVAISTQEAALDVKSMSATSTKVFVLEVMGRHAGWIAASSALARTAESHAPHIILLPEVDFDQAAFLHKVQETITREGYCVIVASEGLQSKGALLASQGGADAFGHIQLGGLAPQLAGIITQELSLKCHFAVADYLQRSARHIASEVDVEQAYNVGVAAVNFALQGKSGIMPALKREVLEDGTVVWNIEPEPLSSIANVERKLPPHYIASCGMDVTQGCVDYISPLIQGEVMPTFRNGIPHIEHFPLDLVAEWSQN